MARGWESKSVESQIEDAESRAERGKKLTPGERQLEQKRQGLELSRRRVLQRRPVERPEGSVAGSGSRVRSIRLASADDLEAPDVQALIAEAVRSHAAGFEAAPPLTTIVKSVSAKQRPRRSRPLQPE